MYGIFLNHFAVTRLIIAPTQKHSEFMTLRNKIQVWLSFHMYFHLQWTSSSKKMYVYEHQSVTRLEYVFYICSKIVKIESGQCHERIVCGNKADGDCLSFFFSSHSCVFV